jgi:hypothetical protein
MIAPMSAAAVRAIIGPALQAIDLWSQAAEDLLLGTAAQESGLRNIRQIGGGPALGLWQMEPATHDDIWTNFLDFRPMLAARVRDLLNGAAATTDQLLANPGYAAAMARLKYYRSPQPLPDQGDVSGYAHAWKAIYNTIGGAGTEAEFIGNWSALIES